MNKIREFRESDEAYVRELHEKYFSQDFDYCDFRDKFLSAFVIENDNKIIMAGGVRPIAETILVTDKLANPHALGEALLEALKFSKYTCQRFNLQFLHAFVKDKGYERHLIKHGFSPRCQALSLEV